MEHEFRLRFRLQPADADMDALVERLYEAGCGDALVGIGVPGRLALDFAREANTAAQAIDFAVADVKRAAATAELIDVEQLVHHDDSCTNVVPSVDSNSV